MKNINDLFLRIVVITNNRYKAREIIMLYQKNMI